MLRRTVRAALDFDNDAQRYAIELEYEAWQRELLAGGEHLHQATKRQAQALRETIRKQNQHSGECPMVLTREAIEVEARRQSPASWWIKIPIYRDAVWVRLRLLNPKEQFTGEVHDCRLLHLNGEYCVDMDVAARTDPCGRIIPVDMGVRKLATVIVRNRPMFFGKEIGRLRSKYWSEADGSRSLVIEEWDPEDRHEVKLQVRVIAKQIVEAAKRTHAIIALGDLGHARNPDGSGGFYKRPVFPPFNQLRQCLTAKANEAGVTIIEVPEAYTSKRCNQCGALGNRDGWHFSCRACGLEIDADVNAAWNIGKRAYHMLRNGINLKPPIAMSAPR